MGPRRRFLPTTLASPLLVPSGSRQIWMIPAGEARPGPYRSPRIYRPLSLVSRRTRHRLPCSRPRRSDLRYFVRNRAEGVPTVVDAINLPKKPPLVVELQSRESEGGHIRRVQRGRVRAVVSRMAFPWSPDSRRITFSQEASRKSRQPSFQRYRGRQRRERRVENADLRRWDGGLSPLVRLMEMRLLSSQTERRDWVTVSHIYVIDARGGKSRKITPEFDEKIKQFFWANGGKSILFAAGQGRQHPNLFPWTWRKPR